MLGLIRQHLDVTVFSILAVMSMVALALALKAMTPGLLVAIPSMVFFNLLVARMEERLLLWTIARRTRLPQSCGSPAVRKGKQSGSHPNGVDVRS